LHIGREIAGVLVLKLLALAAIYLAFFGPAHRPSVTPASVSAHVIGD